jgi:transcriptional regulator of acetoin/glycerol metabolism
MLMLDTNAGPDWDLEICRTARVNVLAIGPDDRTDEFLEALRPSLKHPVAELQGGEPLALPSREVGTLLLSNLHALTPAEQGQLFEALNDRLRGAQVISTSATGLMPLIRDGGFLESLYYRLNTICIDVTTRGPHRNAE